MSLDFWLDLALALGLFGLTLFALPQVRARVLRRHRAKKLRPRLSAALEQLLAIVATRSDDTEMAQQQRQRALHIAMLQLQRYIKQEPALFDDERAHLAEFRRRLQQLWPQVSVASPRTRELEDFLLFGQRLVSDLREHSHA